MTTPADSLFSDPSVQFLQKLLDDVLKGDITLPRFQRPFVWDKERRLQLFDSVRRGIPIGSLMIWETRALGDEATRVVPKTELGPFVLPKVNEGAPRRYLLDGEQRLMTLYFALRRPDARQDAVGEEPASDFEIFFDLEEQKFVTRGDLDGDPCPHHFPLRDIVVPRGVLRFQRGLERALEEQLGPQPSPEQKQAFEKKIADFVERSDTIAEAVQRYKIPVTLLSTDDLELAAETFKRVNSQGVSMSEAHMMNAIAWRSSFDLLERFAAIREAIEQYPLWQDGDNLDDDVLLRVAKRLLDLDVYDENVSAIAPKLREGAVLRRVGDSLKRCAAFLASRGLRNPKYIPNVMQLVVLGRVFDAVPELTEAATDGLEDWLWFTSYAELFSKIVRGSTYKSLEDQALALARGERPLKPSRKPLRKPLPRFDFRSARSRALSWMFARRAMEYDGGKAADALAASGNEALVKLATPPPKSLDVASSPALRVLCRPEAIEALRKDIRDGTADPKLLQAQVLSADALKELRKQPRSVPGFATIRERELNELEEESFRDIYDRLFRDSSRSDAFDD